MKTWNKAPLIKNNVWYYKNQKCSCLSLISYYLWWYKCILKWTDAILILVIQCFKIIRLLFEYIVIKLLKFFLHYCFRLFLRSWYTFEWYFWESKGKLIYDLIKMIVINLFESRIFPGILSIFDILNEWISRLGWFHLNFNCITHIICSDTSLLYTIKICIKYLIFK